MTKGEMTVIAEKKALETEDLKEINKSENIWADDEYIVPDELLQYMKDLDEETLFLDGVKEAVVNDGFDGDVNDIKAVSKFIKNRFIEQGLPSDYLRGTLEKSWLSGKEVSDTDDARIKVYNLCMSLHMNTDDVVTFFEKKYLQKSFNFKRIEECAYYFAFSNGYDYRELSKLLEEINSNIGEKCSEDDSIATEHIKNSIIGIKNRADFITYISENHSAFSGITSSGKRIIEEKIANIEMYLDYRTVIDKEVKDNSGDIEDSSERRQQHTSVKYILSEIYGGVLKQKKQVVSDYSFQSLKYLNFPNEVEISKILNGNKVSHDLIRRTIILFTFFSYYNECHSEETLQEDIYDGFLYEVNLALIRAGFQELYFRNPYDWLFAYCAYRSGDIGPIETLHGLLKDFVD